VFWASVSMAPVYSFTKYLNIHSELETLVGRKRNEMVSKCESQVTWHKK
jgi:hypothetical protein